jgi:hypothetical protein
MVEWESLENVIWNGCWWLLDHIMDQKRGAMEIR